MQLEWGARPFPGMCEATLIVCQPSVGGRDFAELCVAR